jgi:phospholipase C
VIKFIEKRFGVMEPNISPWRRKVTGDLTSCFNFADPDNSHAKLPKTDDFLPSIPELAGNDLQTFIPSVNGVILGVPAQEKGVRPARALPYELNVQATVNPGNSTIVLTFLNTGAETVAFHVRSGNVADPVRFYTVEPGKELMGTWNITSSYDLSVYGPNGFVRFFQGSIGPNAAALNVVSGYDTKDRGSIQWAITNIGSHQAEVSLMDAYTGNTVQRFILPHGSFTGSLSLSHFYGWYDLIITVAGDQTFNYRLAGHVETGADSISDPALGGLVRLKG